MYCNNCGAEATDAKGFCTKCGADLSQSKPGAGVPNQQSPDQRVPAGQQVARTSGLGVASMILGILGLIFVWVPVLGLLFALLAVIFGGVSLSQTGKDPTLQGRGMAVAGTICGVITLGLWFALLAACSSIAFWN